MKTAIALVVLAAVLGQQPAPPESPAHSAAAAAIAAAADPADCVKALRTFIGKRQQEVRPPTGYTAEILKKVEDEKTALAQQCVGRFESSNPAMLPGLADLYVEMNMPEKARAALATALAAQLPPAVRAAALVSSVNAGLREPKSDDRNARLESLIAELDANPEATLDQRWTTHSRMESYYRGDDIDAGILKHARWMAETARTFTPEQRTRLGASLVQSQINAAEALAGEGMNDEALALLRRTAEEWRTVVPRIEDNMIRPALERYSLVGTPAAPIKAARWLNAASTATEMPMTGAVTLLEFTAHWCGPCRESYPGVNRLRQQFGPKGFRVVLATRYYGYFSKDGKTERDLSNDEEYKRDVAYFADYKLDVPVAIADLVSIKVVDGKVVYTPGPDPNETAYKVSGIPQIQLIDKRGRIRLIMIGYDDANEAKLAEIIGKLLAES